MSDSREPRTSKDGECGQDAKDSERPQHLSPYPLSRQAPAFDLVDLAREIARADDMLTAQTNGKLRLLAEQIRALQEEAKRILEQTRRNQELHRAQCNFVKRCGQVYHLYRRPGGDLVLSLLSPQDWGGLPPFVFVGSFRLENDMSWTKIRE